MEILDLIDSLESLVVHARRLPVGSNLVIDRRGILDLIDQLRLAVPADVRQAAQILEQREHVLLDAQQRAQVVVEDAQKTREQLLNETTMLTEAQERSQAIIIDAEARARQTVAEADATAAAHLSEAAEAATNQLGDADRYALSVIERLQGDVRAILESLERSGESLQQDR